MVYLGGPEGRVFSYPDRPSSQARSEICVRRHGVSIHGDAVRASTGATYFYKMCGCGTFPSESERDTHIKLFGRLAGVGPFGGCAQQPQTCSITSPREPRSLCEQTKKRVAPQPVNHVSGGAVGLDLDESASESGAHTRFNVHSECIQTGPSRGTEGISEALGTDGGGRDSVSPRSAVYASPPDMAENTGAEKGMENGPCPRCGHSQVLERAETMAEPRPVPVRRQDGFGHVAESGYDGRVDDGLESSLRRHTGLELLDRFGENVAH